MSVNLIELQQAVDFLRPIARYGEIYNCVSGLKISLPRNMHERKPEQEDALRAQAAASAITILKATEDLLPALLAKQEAAPCA